MDTLPPIETVAIALLLQDPANVRRHSPRNIQAIKASLQRFGQQKPIVIDAAHVVRAGNGTLEAARQLGWTHLQVIRTALTGADAVAYAIADNRTAELADWDAEALAQQVRSLDGPLQQAAGFADGELDALLARLNTADAAVGDLSSADSEAESHLRDVYEIAVECKSEADQQQLFARLRAEGRVCRVLTL